MSTTWEAPARSLIEPAPASWDRLWSLVYAAGRAASTLSLSVPFGQGVALTYAALDLREARDELDWLDGDLAHDALAVDLGPFRPTDDGAAARGVISDLASAALDLAATLADVGKSPAELNALTRVSGKVFSARAAIDQAMP